MTLVYGCSCASECVGRTAYYRPATADFQLATMATNRRIARPQMATNVCLKNLSYITSSLSKTMHR